MAPSEHDDGDGRILDHPHRPKGAVRVRTAKNTVVPKHAAGFLAVRAALFALVDDKDRARLAALFGSMTQPHRTLGELRRIVRFVATLDDADLERLAKWFSTCVSRWGQMPRATGMNIDAKVRRDPQNS